MPPKKQKAKRERGLRDDEGFHTPGRSPIVTREAARAKPKLADAPSEKSSPSSVFSEAVADDGAAEHMISSGKSVKAGSQRTTSSMRETKRALLLKRLADEKQAAKEVIDAQLQAKIQAIELDKHFAEEQFRIEADLLEEESVASQAASVASAKSNRLRNWIANTDNAFQAETRPVAQAEESPNNWDLRRDQVAARRALAKELPAFTGKPEEWPAFYASYRYSTQLCGYRPEENLLRLQRCLKGAALEAVQGRLILPESVPQVIETLRKRFGRPEWLIQALIEKVQQAPTPKPDKLGTIIKFGNAIQGLCDHIRAADLPEHLQNPCLMQTLVAKLPPEYRMRWAAFRRGKTGSSLELFAEYMGEIVDDASCVEPYEAKEDNALHRDARGLRANKSAQSSFKSFAAMAKPGPRCAMCKEEHWIQQCPKFLSQQPEQRRRTIMTLKHCLNCLRAGHMCAKCPWKYGCKQCKQRHNSLLHTGSRAAEPNSAVIINNDETTTSVEPPSELSVISAMAVNAGSVVLQTAIVNIIDAFGVAHPVRALLDSASQPDLITEQLAKRLQLPMAKANIALEGAGQHISPAKGTVFTELKSRHEEFSLKVQFLVMGKLVSKLPSWDLKLPKVSLPPNTRLADPWFNKSQPIDIILGARHYPQFFSNQKMAPHPHYPVLLNSVFGWVATGPVGAESASSSVRVDSDINPPCMVSLEAAVEKFWEMESVEIRTNYTPEEQYCEELFKSSTRRDEEGRYIVKLPRKPGSDAMIGNSKKTALRRFELLEKRLDRNAELKCDYHQFMHEYLDMGHMHLLSPEEESKPLCSYYLPHHPVFKQDSTTTKVRVVFDASAKTAKGYSLNEALCIGPVVQKDLLDIVMRFRTYKVALIGDIAKMYRQILLDESDRSLVRIMFRFNQEVPIQTYQLNTVTYGLAPSSFLATRTLLQLVEDEGSEYPEAGASIRDNFYMDDFIGGADNEEDAIHLRKSLTELLAKGKFEIRKWASNQPEVLEGLRVEEVATRATVSVGHSDTIKALGICWMPTTDELYFKVAAVNHIDTPTKRSVLSSIAKLFDPLGLLGSIVVKAKIVMQQLWLAKGDWDDPIPNELAQQWNQFHCKAGSKGSCCCQQEPTSQEAECNHQMQLRVQQFWKHWKSEYLQELQKDTVRASRNNGIRLGRMAILIDEMLPVTRWPLARITKIHPGKDGIPRVE
ncbi:uncharacterized protein LOC125959546 [Anopheles darlingi]|uniref:uncharacterized protein LOC125959546 n=1 Tax=Anopheles darlingi TaxID=43151 RepID=UPI00210007C0|nr:uncharacterized protein LOC125959546 [Anopheles darlingi]